MFESWSVMREVMEESNRNRLERRIPRRERWRSFGARKVNGSATDVGPSLIDER